MNRCPHCGQPMRRRVDRVVGAKRERRRQQIKIRNAEIVRLAQAGKSPKMIEGILNVTTAVIAPVLSAARADGIAIPYFPRGGAALNHHVDKPKPAPPAPAPVTPSHRVAPVMAGPAKSAPPSTIAAVPYETRLRDLAAKGVALTGMAAILGRPYREIIADMERLGLSRVKA